MKNIAIDYSWFGPTGIGRVAKEITDRHPPSWKIEKLRVGEKNAGIFTPISIFNSIKKSKADLFWSPGFMPPLYFRGKLVILTIHDLTHLHFYNLHHKIYYNFIIKRLIKKASLIITVSEFSRNEIIAWSGVNKSKVKKIYNGVDSNFSPRGSKANIGRPYILYVGNSRDYKNINRLMRAFSNSGLSKKGFMLALTGEETAIQRKLKIELGLVKDIYYFGFVPDGDLPSVYRGAHALSFVSLYEGFGLPIVEAMACGVPVITSEVSSMPEISDGACLLVNPYSIEEISNGLVMIACDNELRANLIEKGFVRASFFSWEKAAKSYWEVFEKALTESVDQ